MRNACIVVGIVLGLVGCGSGSTPPDLASELELYESMGGLTSPSEVCVALLDLCENRAKGCLAHDVYCTENLTTADVCAELTDLCDRGSPTACAAREKKCSDVTPTPDAGAACVPSCSGKCGGASDGCGGSCEHCAAGQWCQAGACGTWSGVTLYVVPALTDTKILPSTSIDASRRAAALALQATPGEFEPASFVVHANSAVSSLQLEPTDLVRVGGGVIPAANVAVRAVKCWWQAGVEVWDNEPSTKLLTPELLLKDDALVRVSGTTAATGKNELKLNGSYVDVSAWNLTQTSAVIHTPTDFPVRDAASLQPVAIPAGENKQFWVTVEVPAAAQAGAYQGRLLLKSGALTGSLELKVEVLPFTLAKPRLIYSIYYTGRLTSKYPSGTLSSSFKSAQQLRAELSNMIQHGVTNPTVAQYDRSRYAEYLDIRQSLGMGGQPIYDLGLEAFDPATTTTLKQSIVESLALLKARGATGLYVYGFDEATASEVAAERPVWEAAHQAGAKVFVSAPASHFSVVGDLLDLVISSTVPSAADAAKWHSTGKQIFSYNNPQVAAEQPALYRHNYGLHLWQKDYDGAMDYAYQQSYGSIWNDFDHKYYRDHNFTYPTVDGVIDTIQWEGFREGVDDVRYLSTLQELVAQEKSKGKDMSAIESWIAALKSSTLSDLNAVRTALIAKILCVVGKGSC